MAKLAIKKASTDVTTYVFIQDSSKTTGEGLAGLAYNTGSLVGYYVRPKGSATAITLATQTVTGDHSDGGFVEIDATNMPGVYRLDLPDAVCATGVPSVVVMLKGATDMSPVVLEIQLTDFDLNTAAITAAAVADAVWDEATADHTTASSFGALDANVDAILADTGTDGVVLKAAGLNADAVTKIQSGLALEATLTAIKGAGWSTGDNLRTIESQLTGFDNEIIPGGDLYAIIEGIVTTLTAIKGAGWTNQTLVKIVSDIAAISAGSGATPQQIWEYTNRVLTAGTNIDLSALATATDLATVDTVVDAIKAKTDNLPASPAAVGSAMTLTAAYDKAKDDVLTPLGVVDGIVDAIKVQTDKIPATPASAGEYTANIGAIKAKTDNLPLSPASSGEYTSALTAIQNDLDNPNQYKADVSNLALQATSLAIKGQTDKIPAAPAQTGEYTSALTAIQNDLDNPSQYKADVSGLATSAELSDVEDNIIAAMPDETVIPDGIALETSVQAIKAKTDNLPATPASSGEYTTNIGAIKAKTDNLPTTPAASGEYTSALAAIQSDLDNPDQYKADVSALATQASVNAIPTTPLLAANYVAPDNATIGEIKAKTDNIPATPLTAQQVWEYVTRTLTSQGSGGATAQEVWEYATRVLTAGTNIDLTPLAKTTHLQEVEDKVDGIKDITDQLTFTVPNKVDANADVVLSPEAIENMASAIGEGLTEEIWSSSVRTLTQSPAEIIATILGADITQIRGNSWVIQLTGVALESTQQFAIKYNAAHPDSAAILFVDSTGGLTVLNGIAQDGDNTSKASLVYDGAILTITVDASITAQLPVGAWQYGIQSIADNGIVAEPYGGSFRVLADVVRAID